MEEKAKKRKPVTSRKAMEQAMKYQAEHVDKLSVSMPKGTRAVWQEAADHAGAKNITRWIIDTCNAAAARELDGQPEPAETETKTGSQDHADGQPASPEA